MFSCFPVLLWMTFCYVYIGIMKEAFTIGGGVSDFEGVFCGQVGDDERKLDS